jgi:uridine phosphorylase
VPRLSCAAVSDERAYHVGLAAGEVGAYLLMPGDPFRTERIARHLDGAEERAFSREYRTFTGTVAGTTVSTCSSGIGGPSVAIGVEELRGLGCHTFLRVGTCGGLQPGVRVGDIVIATGAVRDEGTPDAYVPKAYPAVASHDVVRACVEAAAAAGARAHTGIVRSVDALFPELAPDTVPRTEAVREELAVWRRAGVVGSDMESATLMIVASLRGLRAGTILLCVDEVEAGEIAPIPPETMDRFLAVAVDAVRRLIAYDHAASD